MSEFIKWEFSSDVSETNNIIVYQKQKIKSTLTLNVNGISSNFIVAKIDGTKYIMLNIDGETFVISLNDDLRSMSFVSNNNVIVQGEIIASDVPIFTENLVQTKGVKNPFLTRIENQITRRNHLLGFAVILTYLNLFFIMLKIDLMFPLSFHIPFFTLASSNYFPEIPVYVFLLVSLVLTIPLVISWLISKKTIGGAILVLIIFVVDLISLLWLGVNSSNISAFGLDIVCLAILIYSMFNLIYNKIMFRKTIKNQF